VGQIVNTPKIKKGYGEIYIDNISDEERVHLVDKNIVAIDPNMGDLLYCVNSDQRNQVKFRYSQDTRRKETKMKKYRNIFLLQKQELIDGRTITEWETDMSPYNKKTLDFVSFQTYLLNKNTLNLRLAPFYKKYIFRKLKLGSYSRRQITEARMLYHFEQLFGPPEETVISIGDWAQKQNARFHEPVKGKGFRKLFRRAGYKVYLVDEFNTSRRCSGCEDGICSTFRECDNPKPYRNGRILRHGLVKCNTCTRLWNRDTNAASNIWKIAREAIGGRPRPLYLQRYNNQ
jgi:hypothetical protein